MFLECKKWPERRDLALVSRFVLFFAQFKKELQVVGWDTARREKNWLGVICERHPVCLRHFIPTQILSNLLKVMWRWGKEKNNRKAHCLCHSIRNTFHHYGVFACSENVIALLRVGKCRTKYEPWVAMRVGRTRTCKLRHLPPTTKTKHARRSSAGKSHAIVSFFISNFFPMGNWNVNSSYKSLPITKVWFTNRLPRVVNSSPVLFEKKVGCQISSISTPSRTTSTCRGLSPSCLRQQQAQVESQLWWTLAEKVLREFSASEMCWSKKENGEGTQPETESKAWSPCRISTWKSLLLSASQKSGKVFHVSARTKKCW